MKVKKQYLLLLACLVWMIAGGNIVRIGFEVYLEYLTVFNIFLSIIIFAFFQFFIFGRLVKKHTKRIIAYEERQWFIKFFDVKSFIIMAIMMTGGIWLRRSGSRTVHRRILLRFRCGVTFSRDFIRCPFFKNYVSKIKLGIERKIIYAGNYGNVI